jgi:hypothetical protein
MVNREIIAPAAWQPEIRLLHFHAQDKAAWLAAVPFRMTKGAYQFRPELQAYLAEASPDEIDKFYRRTQILPTYLRDELVQDGRVIIADLGLRQKVQALRDGQL